MLYSLFWVIPLRHTIQRPGNPSKERMQLSQDGESYEIENRCICVLLLYQVGLFHCFCYSCSGRMLGGASGSCQPLGNKLNVSGVLDAVKGVNTVEKQNHVCLVRQCSAPSSIKLRLLS
jgi:hypothetical protein